MLGDKAPYRVVPYFFSDLSDWASLEYIGGASEWDEVILRGDPEALELSAWYVRFGRLVGALSIGRPEDLMAARRLIESGRELGDERAMLADPDADLDDLG
jgi:3-phenylpropionate/trans-cinnamate dioxygenase ferredoxin reductase subunit